MKYDLLRLKNNIDKNIEIDETYSFNSEYLEQTDLIELNDVQIKGEITKNCLDNIELSLTIDGVMILPCAMTLKPVEYPFYIEVNGELEELTADLEKKLTNFENTIDILPIIWENILMEIPMRVVSADAEDIKQSGDGWRLITNEEQLTSSPFSELKDLFNDREVR